MHYVTLIGAEDVKKAGYTMRDASERMVVASNQIHDDLNVFVGRFAEQIDRFEEMLEDFKKVTGYS